MTKKFIAIALAVLVGLGASAARGVSVDIPLEGAIREAVKEGVQEALDTIDSAKESLGASVEEARVWFTGGLRAGPSEEFFINKYGFRVGDSKRLVFGEMVLPWTTGTTTPFSTISPGNNLYPGNTTGTTTIFVYNTQFVMTGAPTTTYAVNPAIRVGTSTLPYLINDDDAAANGSSAKGNCGYTGFCANAVASDASLLNTGSILGGSQSQYGGATSTFYLFDSMDFTGTDTRDGSGTRFVVPVAPADYIVGFASSSVPTIGATGSAAFDIVSSARTLNGHLVIRYYKYVGGATPDSR